MGLCDNSSILGNYLKRKEKEVNMVKTEIDKNRIKNITLDGNGVDINFNLIKEGLIYDCNISLNATFEQQQKIADAIFNILKLDVKDYDN